jgi:metal-dependent HD superfamily phosphatase/phosphodiesterase
LHSPKELQFNDKIEARLVDHPVPQAAYQLLRDDPEIAALQDYSNIVSIKRLGYNDHGPVHMRKVTYNAVKMATFLQQRDIPLSLEKEDVGSFDDSLTAVILAAFLHDVGMSISRSFHENTGIWLAQPIIERILLQLYPTSLAKRVILRSLAMECIMGHMATIHIHSLEAGLILVADGCDMEKGRARIPMMLSTDAKLGDIHKYSAAAVDKVNIIPGERTAIRVDVHMTETVGFFQVEEVLFPKIKASPVKPHVELYAFMEGLEPKCYL